MTIVAPIFMEDRLVGWSGSAADTVDIDAVGWSADARQISEEGCAYRT